MKRKLKWLLIVPGVLMLLLFAMIIFSPYKTHKGFSYKLVKHTVQINAPVDEVFAYLGNSENASKWSVFVNHIITLNADKVADGKPGSIRRCFVQADKKGIQWDELITEVIPGKKRQLVIYNMVDFPISAQNLATEQLYKSTNGNACVLTFTVFFKDVEPSIGEKLKMYFAAYKIKSIFKKNMNNIKRNIES